MHDEGRDFDLGQQLGDVDGPGGLEITRGTFSRSRLALQIVETIYLLLVSVGHQSSGEQLANGRVVGAPFEPHQGHERPAPLALIRRAFVRATRKPAVEDQMRDAVGVLYRVGYRDGTSLRVSQ